MKIQVQDDYIATEEFSVEEMAGLAPVVVELSDRVPSVQGEAFDLKAWYQEWKRGKGVEEASQPTHLKVEAVDEFQAIMLWSQLDQAVFLYAQEGKPLHKGYPIRLYVPNGSSECLNVKSVVRICFLHDASLSEEASYGYKNTVTPSELRLKK